MLKLITQQGKDIWVTEKSFSIGSADDNQLVIDEPTLGAHHARILFNGKHHTIKDLRAPNGTFVNGQRINQRQIANGDVVDLGDLRFQVLDPLAQGNQSEWCLVASANWHPGKAFTLPFDDQNPVITIGRASHCAVTFPGTHLAREHITLTKEEGYLELKDLGSSNGTFLNDKRINSGKVYPGDSLRLDVYSFKVFGPTEHVKQKSSHASSTVSTISQTAPEPDIGSPSSEQKQWKTRPTSPGNRPEFYKKNTVPIESLMLKFGALMALMGLLILGVYLWIG